MTDLFGGLGSLFDDFSNDGTPTLTNEDMLLWKLPTPPQSPSRDELPETEESIDLTQFGKLDKDMPLDTVDMKESEFDMMDTDFSVLMDFMSSPTEIEEFSPEGDGLLSLTQSLQGFYNKEEGECVMMRGDIMWSESSRDPSPVRNKRDPTLSSMWDSALNVALQSDVLPPFPALSKDKATEELSYRERSVALGTDTPSDSGKTLTFLLSERGRG